MSWDEVVKRGKETMDPSVIRLSTFSPPRRDDFGLSFAVGREIVKKLGLTETGRVRVYFGSDSHAGKVKFSPLPDHGGHWTFSVAKNGTGRIKVGVLPWPITPDDSWFTKPLTFEVMNVDREVSARYLVVDLPKALLRSVQDQS